VKDYCSDLPNCFSVSRTSAEKNMNEFFLGNYPFVFLPTSWIRAIRIIKEDESWYCYPLQRLFMPAEFRQVVAMLTAIIDKIFLTINIVSYISYVSVLYNLNRCRFKMFFSNLTNIFCKFGSNRSAC